MKFVNLAIPFFWGILLLQFFKTLPNIFWLFLVPLAIVFWILCDKLLITFPVALKISTRFLVFFVFGFCWALFFAKWYLNWSLPKYLEGKSIVVQGYIASLPENKAGCSFFEFVSNAKIKLIWCGKYPELNVGDKWQLNVRLKRPHGTFNPGGFDLEKNFFQKKIRAIGYVIASTANQRISIGYFGHMVDKLRQKLREKILNFTHPPMSQIITDLVVGDEGGITAYQWQIFRDTGTSYLMAISGLHIGLVATFGHCLSRLIWRCFPSLLLILPISQAAALGGLGVAIIYSIISGLSIPTQRALVMLVIFVVANQLKRQLSSWDSLLLALFIVLLLDPLAVMSAGFCLSFSAVAFIIFVSNSRLQLNNSWWRKFVRMQLAVFIGILPFSLLLFQQVSFVSLIANIIALPGVCLLVTPFSILGTGLLFISSHVGAALLWLCEKTMIVIWIWLEWVKDLNLGNWNHAVVNNWILVATIIGAILLLAPRKFPAKWLGIFWLLPLIYYKPLRPNTGEIWLTLLDVGQGLAVVIQTKDHILIYDTGPKYLTSNAGETIIAPFLRSLAINTIDILILSHEHYDHIGGALALIKTFKIKQLYTSVPNLFANNGAQRCYEGIAWRWNDVLFTFLAPPKYSPFISGNNASCVLLISNGANRLLLVGDIERPAEELLLKTNGENLAADVLIAPHHGSRTSSIRQFVIKTHPHYVLFPIGYRNRFRFPSKQVIRRYKQVGAKMYDTANSGAILFKINSVSSVYFPELYRLKNQHFWNTMDSEND